jgi:hypothetical protein
MSSMMNHIAKEINEVTLEETPLGQAKQQLVVHQTQRRQERLAEEEQRINDDLLHKEQELLTTKQHIKNCPNLAEQSRAQEIEEEINEHYRKLALHPACIPARSV